MASQKVLIFSPFNFAPSFLGLNLEFLQQEIDKGNDVIYMTCDKSFKSCGFNTFELKYMCEICVKRYHIYKKNIEGSYKEIKLKEILIEDDNQYATSQLNGIDVIRKTFVVENFEVGESVYSSFISKTKEKNFSSHSDMRILKTLAYQSLAIYKALKRFIEVNRISKVILFNGRWDYYRAALSAARASGIQIRVVEHLREGGYYEIFDDALPHNMIAKNKLVEDHWNKTEAIALKEQIARDFFIRKRNGAAIMGPSFTKDQKRGNLPQFIDDNKKLIALYNSSDYEFEAVGKEYSNPFFEDQASSILYVAELVSNRPDFQLVIRMHPNLKGLKRDFLKPIYDLEGKYINVFIVKPDEVVDSYALMEKAYKVITYVSTMGIEASYWGKPVVLLSKSIYSPAEIAYTPESIKSIPNLIFDPLTPKPRVNAEKFAYYFLTGGAVGQYYNYNLKMEFFFKNKKLNFLPFLPRTFYWFLKQIRMKN